MSSDKVPHGTIIGGVVATPALDAALADYRDVLGLVEVENGALDPALAQSWGCPGNAGARFATLQPRSGAHCFIRLVEQPMPAAFRPTRSFGWAAYEMTVEDVYSWPARLDGSGFDVVGPPKEIAGLPYFVPMQVTGRGREMIYLNEVRENTPSSDLPKAQSLTDRIFICILATADRVAALDWYRNKLGLDEGDSYTLEYTMINKAFGLAEGTQSTITMVQKGRLPIIEVDQYPDAASERPRAAGVLPPGNALMTLAVDSLDARALDWIVPPDVHPGPVYAGRRSATVIGLAGELLELIEAA